MKSVIFEHIIDGNSPQVNQYASGLKPVVTYFIITLLLSLSLQIDCPVYGTNLLDLFGSWEGFDVYENPLKGIKIRYLSNWTVDDAEDPEDPAFIVQFYSPNKDADMIVYGANLGNPSMGLQELFDYTLASYKNSSEDFELVKSSVDSELSGYPAYELVYNDTKVLDNSSLKVTERGTIIGNIVYTVIFEAHPNIFSSHLSAFKKILDSFETSSLSSLIR